MRDECRYTVVCLYVCVSADTFGGVGEKCCASGKKDELLLLMNNELLLLKWAVRGLQCVCACLCVCECTLTLLDRRCVFLAAQLLRHLA